MTVLNKHSPLIIIYKKNGTYKFNHQPVRDAGTKQTLLNVTRVAWWIIFFRDAQCKLIESFLLQTRRGHCIVDKVLDLLVADDRCETGSIYHVPFIVTRMSLVKTLLRYVRIFLLISYKTLVTREWRIEDCPEVEKSTRIVQIRFIERKRQ